MKRTTNAKPTMPVTALLTLAALAMPVSAQQQANNGGGRALDANPQAGSGGINDTQGQVDYRLRNNIITGNVQSGRGFQGTINYSAPGEFQSTLGSDSLFQFRTQSLPSSPNRLNAVSSGRAYIAGDGVSIYRSYTSLPPAQPFGRSEYTPANTLIGGYSTGLDTSYSIGSLTAGMTSTQDTIGLASPTAGRVLELSASPLLGLRSIERPGQALTPTTPTTGLLIDAQQPETSEQDQQLRDKALQDQGDLRSSLQLDPRSRQLSSGIGTGIYAEQTPQVAPGLVIGQQLSTQLSSRLTRPGEAEAAQRRFERMQQRLFGKAPAQELEAGEDAYADLMRAVRDRDQLVAQPKPEKDEPEQPGTLRAPSQRQLDTAERARQNALEQWQMRTQQADRTSEQQEAGETPAGPQAPQAPQAPRAPVAGGEDAPEALKSLMSQLNYDLPPLETLAGTRKTRANAKLREAEQELTAGNYFAAEGLYRQALVDQPGEPLAIVGMVHAELGAGLIRSAALNLRRLFEQHPELIAARYDARLLPSGDRLRWLQQELERVIGEQHGAATDPGLLLAYLGYQNGSRSLTRYGLTVAEAGSPRDPLLPMLRHIWLDIARQTNTDADANADDAQDNVSPSAPSDGK